MAKSRKSCPVENDPDQYFFLCGHEEPSASVDQLGGAYFELQCRGQWLIASEWRALVHRAGLKLECQGEWESVCDDLSSDRFYSEKVLSLSHQVKLEDQVAYFRLENLIFLAQRVISPSQPKSSPLQSETRWQVAPDCSLDWAQEGTTELYLFHSSATAPVARIIPLSVSEWREETDEISLDDPHTLKFRHTGPGPRYHAILIDFNPERITAPLTWRRLTVAAGGEKVSPTEGVAFRYQAQDDQFVIYRSFTGPQLRSFLGLHTAEEFVFGRFEQNGTITKMLEVGPSDDSSDDE